MAVVRRNPCDAPLRHAWFPADTDWTPPYGGTPVTLRCEREGCGKERRDAYGENTGDLVYRRYVDPPNWYSYGKDERPTIGEMRMAFIEQSIAAARDKKKADRR